MNFVELPKVELNYTMKIVNMEKLELDIKDFKDNDVIVINSGTATGKTRIIGKLASEMIEDGKYKFLSIVNLISLAREQIKTFYEESKMKLSNYQEGISTFNESDGVICINSLHKLQSLEEYDLRDKIIYIDEINDLLKSLTHYDGLDSILNMTYTFLIKLIKNCKKLILSDATIDNNIENLLMSRKTNNKTILIKNIVQKFKDIKANEFLDEELFLNRIRKSIDNDEYFLFGCDGCKRITGIYTMLLSEFENKKDKFRLYTSEELVKVEDASIEFKDKFIFYSPSITTGVSFVLKDIKQPQYIYITKKPLITPESIYQMSCRTRNMKELNFYSSVIKDKSLKYASLKELETDYKKMVRYNNRLLGLSTTRTQDDEIEIIDNTFFKCFCFNQYKKEIFHTGFIQHYKGYLIRDGFIISSIGNVKELERGEQENIKMMYDLKKSEDIDEFIKLTTTMETEEDYEKLMKKYKIYIDRTDLLNLSNINELNTYRKYVEDEYILNSYFTSLALFKTSEYTLRKLKEKKSNSFDVKTAKTVYNKVQLLETFEKHYKIERFNLDFKDVNPDIEIDKEFKQLYEILFPRLTTKSYKTKRDLLKIYINLIKDITNEIPFIKSKKIKNKTTKKSENIYILNITMMQEIINLTKLKNETLKDCNINLIEKLTGIKPEQTQKREYKDDDDCLNNYVFNKSYKQGIKENINNANLSNIEKLRNNFSFKTLTD